MVETFPIVPRQSSTAFWVVIPVVLIPLLIGVGATASDPAHGAGLLAIFVPVVALTATAFLVSIAASRRARFEVSRDGLRLRGDLYGRTIPAAQLRAAEARAVDLRAERALAPVARRFGTALPGYDAGWFRLRNGERALLYLTDRSRVAYVPTTAGYAVLVSVADPAAFVASLGRHARQASPGG